VNQCQISVGAMGLAIQRYLGSNERGGGVTTVSGASTSDHRQNARSARGYTENNPAQANENQRDERRPQAPERGDLHSNHWQGVTGCRWLRPRIAHCRISNQRPLCERAGHLSTGTGCQWLAQNSAALLVFGSSVVHIGFFRRCQCQSPILAQCLSMPV
jgi:hypothetical protein